MPEERQEFTSDGLTATSLPLAQTKSKTHIQFRNLDPPIAPNQSERIAFFCFPHLSFHRFPHAAAEARVDLHCRDGFPLEVLQEIREKPQ